MIRGKRVRTITEHERLKKGLRKHMGVTREEKDADKAVSVWAWTQFYHKPYANDWQQAHQKAIERKLRYKHETLHDGHERQV